MADQVGPAGTEGIDNAFANLVPALESTEALALEPELACVAALHSPSTGIVDSHALMLSLQGDLENAGGMVALHSPLALAQCALDAIDLTMQDGTRLRAKTVINAAGRHAVALARRFAGVAGQHVSSNALVLDRRGGAPGVGAAVGFGGGLPSRVDAVRLAVAKAGERARGSVLASDAFFPFADGLEAVAAAGVTAVVEPGGSGRDDDVVAAADRLGGALVFTGVRPFRP